MISYKEISNTIEKLIKSDILAKSYYDDMIHKSESGELRKSKEIHPFLTYILTKVRQVHGDISMKELKRGIIHFYSKNFLGIDVDLW